MKTCFFILIGIVLTLKICNAQPNSKVWTPKYESGFYNYIDSTSKTIITDKAKRQKYVAFLVRRVKEELPNGLNSVSKDSLQTLHIRVEREYAINEYGTGNADLKPFYEKWSPYTDKAFRQNYVAILGPKFPVTINKFCDCIIGKLKKIYPDSVLLPVPKDINMRVTKECRDVL